MRVARLGARCDIAAADRHVGPGASFDVQEFADLDDGPRLTLQEGRGFSVGAVDPWPGLTLAQLEACVLTTVLPDEDSEDAHPWGWLAEQIRARGVDVSPEDLKHVPYDVVLSPRLQAEVAKNAPHAG